MKMPRVAVRGRAILLLGSFLSSVGGQTQGKGSVEGQAVNLANGQGMASVIVDLQGPYSGPIPGPSSAAPATPAPPVMHAQVDAQGHFAFTNLGPGTYRLHASREGFIHESTRETEAILVSAGQAVENLVLKLTPYSIVTGKVTGDGGEPIQNASVRAVQFEYDPGGRVRAVPLGPGVRTDDRGVYRERVAPGMVYTVAAEAPSTLIQTASASGQAYPVTYYGDTPEVAGAATFFLGMSETRTADITLRRAKLARVRGRLIAPSGMGKGPGTFIVAPADGKTMLERVAGPVATNLVAGNFEILGLVPRPYQIVVSTVDGAERLVGAETVNVRGDKDGVKIQLVPALRIFGSIKVEGNAVLDFQRTRLRPSALGPIPITRQDPPAPIREDLSFEVGGLFPVKHAVYFSHLPSKCYVKSMLYDGTEVPAEGFIPTPGKPLTVILSSAGAARLEVVVSPASQPGRLGEAVTLIPLDGPAMSAQEALRNDQGIAIFETVRPGKYLVTAWDRSESATWVQAAGLESLKPLEPWSKIVTLEPDGKQSIQLTVMSFADRKKAFGTR
jgi:hypothetical protein